MAHELSRPSDSRLPPGAARCPGPSTREIIQSDGDGAPAVLTSESYEFLGDADISYDRYTSRAFFEREIERLWPRTWQWACREEHVPRVGDYVVYDVGPYSFIVVRTAPGEIKAFVNSCPHRGMQWKAPASQGNTGSLFRCPFHGMTWYLDGRLREIPCRWDFPHVDESSFRPDEARVATWGGFVFINPDPDAPPLREFLGVLPEHFAGWPLEKRYVALHVEKRLPANWKMALEAFLEAYHVLATHPEGMKTAGDANAQYDVFGENVTRFVHTIGYPSPHLRRPPSPEQILKLMDAWDENAARRLADGVPARVLIAEKTAARLGARYRVDLSGVSASEMLDSIEYHLFPNMFLFPGVSLPMIYRFRPNGMDVDSCLHEILFLAPLPASGDRPPPAKVVRLAEEESYTTVPGFDPGLAFVYDQDTGNLRRQRDGVKASRKRGQTLGNYQEVRLRRFQMTLDAWLAREGRAAAP
jgi:phenylpropionate dioxygenase-like ring-hydroxylating dioxygenase large terminal subunit